MKKILVADDEPHTLQIVTDRLEHEGYEVVTAVDGQEALERARTTKPDLIVLDVMLPKIDGYKVCAMLKFDANYKDIPVFLFTARAGTVDEKIGDQIGADLYITKTSDFSSLIAAVNEKLK
ncbi:MAG: response regulator [Candidatus Omnitrophica bacterium]|nr:response regulator [Candidatus Omnitrophota bacterium]